MVLPELHSRRGARALLWAAPVCVLYNVVLARGLGDRMDIDHDAVNRYLSLNLPAHVLYFVLNAIVLWRPHRAERTYRVVAITSGILLGWTTVISLWLHGTVSQAQGLVLVMVTVAIYRVYYDRAVGLPVLLVTVAAHAAVVALEVTRVIQPHALFPELDDPTYRTAATQLGTFTQVLFLYAATFVCAELVSNRFAKAERALRTAEDARAALRARVAELEARALRDGPDTEPDRRLTGTILAGAYALGERLGAGGMGEVYAARRLTDGAEVAIKVLHPHLAVVPRFLERFRREAEAAAKLPGHLIARVLEFGVTEERHHFIAMERLIGEDLEKRLAREGKLAPDAVAALTRTLAEALDAAHAQRLIHRDLKPPNVFLVDGDGPRLLDFGIVRPLETDGGTLTSVAVVLGTPGYLAPEQALGQADKIGPATDVFALGAVIYRALTGRPAFSVNDKALALFELVHRDPPAPSRMLPSLHVHVDAVIALALAKDPARRTASAGELSRQLDAALAGKLPDDVLARAAALPSTTRDTPAPGDTLVEDVSRT